MLLIQLFLVASAHFQNCDYRRRFLTSSSTYRISFNGVYLSHRVKVTGTALISTGGKFENEPNVFSVSSMVMPYSLVCETMMNIATGYTSAAAIYIHFNQDQMLSKKLYGAWYPHSRLFHVHTLKNHNQKLGKKKKTHKRTGRGARFGRGGGWWRHKCPRRQAGNSSTSVMWWLPNMCNSFCERNFPGKCFRGCVAGDGPSLADGTPVARSGVDAMSLGEMSQILRHMKGECRSGRCIIELSFDDHQTFEIFREHCSTVSTIRSYLQVHTIDLQFYVPTRRDDNGLYYHTNPDGLCSIRSALIAEKYANGVSERLPSDVTPMNAKNQSELASYIRDRIQRIQLSTDERNFVDKAIHFIEKNDLGQSPL